MTPVPTSSPASEPPTTTDAELEISKYGLGTQRSLEEYSHACGVNFSDRKITLGAKSGNLHLSELVDPVLDMVMRASQLIPLDG